MPLRRRAEIIPLVSVPAIYDGERVRLLEAPPFEGPYQVVVTFLEPAPNVSTPLEDSSRFLASFGAWKDERPIEATLRDIHEARRSRSDPPSL